MILKVARLGHPVLRQVAEPVPPGQIATPQIQQFIDDLIETMYEYDGAGLAAPQVHVSQQIVVMEVGRNPRYPHAPEIPLTVYINPEITSLTEDMDEDWEGCLSVPGLRVPVSGPGSAAAAWPPRSRRGAARRGDGVAGKYEPCVADKATAPPRRVKAPLPARPNSVSICAPRARTIDRPGPCAISDRPVIFLSS